MMLFPKEVTKKKRKQHKPSILHKKDGTCYLCMRLNNDHRIHSVTQEHHIYGGPNRSISEREGLKVYLCMAHHTCGKAAVHTNAVNMRILQQDGQKAYEREHTRTEFVKIIGRNYLL